jgi:hypothetical protein
MEREKRNLLFDFLFQNEFISKEEVNVLKNDEYSIQVIKALQFHIGECVHESFWGGAVELEEIEEITYLDELTY